VSVASIIWFAGGKAPGPTLSSHAAPVTSTPTDSGRPRGARSRSSERAASKGSDPATASHDGSSRTSSRVGEKSSTGLPEGSSTIGRGAGWFIPLAVVGFRQASLAPPPPWPLGALITSRRSPRFKHCEGGGRMHLLLRTETLAVGGDRLTNIVDDVTNTDSRLTRSRSRRPRASIRSSARPHLNSQHRTSALCRCPQLLPR
jgi:hypothetical protein